MARLSVYAVNYPLAYFAERIGGDLVEVSLPAPPDVDPAYWSPDAETIAAYQGADLILLNGADYAKWVGRASLPAARAVDTAAGFVDRLIPLENTVTHTHGPGGEHAHAGWAFTTWLDPELARQQAAAIRDALVLARPDAEDLLTTGFAALESDLLAVDRELEAVFRRLGPTPLLVSHPVYQYLIRRYDLDARSLHWEPDEVPDEAAWEELASLLVEHPAKVMIWEAEPLPEVRRRLTELDLEVLVYRPVANRPDEGDWLSVLRANQHQLRATTPDS